MFCTCFSSYARDVIFQGFKWQLKHVKHDDHLLMNVLVEKYKMKMYYGITEWIRSKFTVTSVGPAPPAAVTVRTSQHADTILSALAVPRLDHAFVETVSRHLSEHQQLAKPHDKSLPPEKRAGSKGSCWESQLARLRGAEQTDSHCAELPMYHYSHNGLLNLCSTHFVTPLVLHPVIQNVKPGQ